MLNGVFDSVLQLVPDTPARAGAITLVFYAPRPTCQSSCRAGRETNCSVPNDASSVVDFATVGPSFRCKCTVLFSPCCCLMSNFNVESGDIRLLSSSSPDIRVMVWTPMNTEAGHHSLGVTNNTFNIVPLTKGCFYLDCYLLSLQIFVCLPFPGNTPQGVDRVRRIVC